MAFLNLAPRARRSHFTHHARLACRCRVGPHCQGFLLRNLNDRPSSPLLQRDFRCPTSNSGPLASQPLCVRFCLARPLSRGAISSGPSSPPQQNRAEVPRAPRLRGPGTSPGSAPLTTPPRLRIRPTILTTTTSPYSLGTRVVDWSAAAMPPLPRAQNLSQPNHLAGSARH